jgi:hypothetical protein
MRPSGLSVKEYARIQELIARNSEHIEWCSQQLAMNFDCPAQRIIGVACGRMGISRLDWEKITAVRNGWEYTAPPANLLARWGSY